MDLLVSSENYALNYDKPKSILHLHVFTYFVTGKQSNRYQNTWLKFRAVSLGIKLFKVMLCFKSVIESSSSPWATFFFYRDHRHKTNILILKIEF